MPLYRSILDADCGQVTYLSSGGKVGDLLRAEVTCDKCNSVLNASARRTILTYIHSRKDDGLYVDQVHERQGRIGGARESHEVWLIVVVIEVTNVYARYVAIAWNDPQNITDELKPEKS